MLGKGPIQGIPPATTVNMGKIEIATDAEAAAETATDKALVPSNISSMAVTPKTHATTHVTGGGDTVADAIAAGNSGLMSGTDKTKLDGIEVLADVTDTANVTAAGALMDSEVDADIKTLVLPASTTISTFGASLVDDTTAALARATLVAAVSGANNDITSMTGLDDDGIPGLKVDLAIPGAIGETTPAVGVFTILNMGLHVLTYDDSSLSGTPIIIRLQDYAGTYYYAKMYLTASATANATIDDIGLNVIGITDATLSGTPKVFEIKSNVGTSYYVKAYPTISAEVTSSRGITLTPIVHVDAILSGTPRVASVQIGGADYYTKAYPTKA